MQFTTGSPGGRWAALAQAGRRLFASLDFAATLEELVRAAVPTFADWCALDLKRPDGSLRRVAVAHIEPAHESLLFELGRHRGSSEATRGVPLVMRTGQIDHAEEVTAATLIELGLDGDGAAQMQRVGLRSFACAPLEARGGTIGAITFGIGESSRRFGAEELALASELAQMGALAIGNARRFQHAEEQARRAAFLAEAGAQMTSALDHVATLARVVRLAVPYLADWCAIDLLDDEGALQRVAAAHSDPARTEHLFELSRRATLGPGFDHGLPRVIRTGEPDLISDIPDELVAAFVPDPISVELVRRVGCRSYLCVPLVARGQTLGALMVVMGASGRRLESADVPFVEDLARRIALAVDNARLIKRAQEAHRRAAFLAEVGSQLVASLDLHELLDRLARLAVPHLADYCAIDLAVGNGTFERVAIAHVDPTKVEAVREVGQRVTFALTDDVAFNRTLRTGESVLIPLMPREALEAFARKAGALPLLRELDVRSYLCAALKVNGRVLGTVTLATAESQRRLGPADVAMAEELARRASLAVENARLYGDAQAAVKVREEFLSVASHELRSPLGALAMAVDVLIRDTQQRRPDAEARLPDMLERMARQARRLEALIDNLFDATRITHGQLSLKPEEIDLPALVTDVTSRFHEELRRAGSTASIHVAAPAIGRWDRMALDQVITNLVTNAIKFCSGRPIEIVVDVDAAQALARLSVRDHGIGIAPSDQQRIFQRFERVGDGESGLGLGLFIVAEIVAAHRGRVLLESEVGAGSVFTVELPLSL